MITKISSRHSSVSNSLKEYIEKKLARLSRFHGKIMEIEVILDSEGTKSTIEIIVHTADGAKPFVLNYAEEGVHACIDGAIDRSERQLLKHKEQVKNHKGKTGAGEASVEVIGE
ncbi:MAG: ribosome-associated translation inhibitor RaiA [Sedimentisphaerales bacterium]|nr:ribosome-associated translation inhibitor RaiA [Sedimentisphaerales bacterium]MBN2842497.1 ribosome-associated translation inhibitor RaiA [Sedimentisphaerales bacterium]